MDQSDKGTVEPEKSFFLENVSDEGIVYRTWKRKI